MLHGRGYLVGDALTDEAMRDAWELHRESLRAEWAAENPPGTRGFSEWLCEIIPRHGERPVTRWWTAEHERHRAAWLLHGVLHTRTWPESQNPSIRSSFVSAISTPRSIEPRRCFTTKPMKAKRRFSTAYANGPKCWNGSDKSDFPAAAKTATRPKPSTR